MTLVIDVASVGRWSGTSMGWIVVSSTDQFVFLRDLDDGGKTITNDAERVLKQMARAYPGRRVVYQASDSTWWEILHRYQNEHALEPWYQIEFRPWHGLVWDALTRPY